MNGQKAPDWIGGFCFVRSSRKANHQGDRAYSKWGAACCAPTNEERGKKRRAGQAVCYETDGTIKEKAMLRVPEHRFLIFAGL
jgi:hypothetical protein